MGYELRLLSGTFTGRNFGSSRTQELSVSFNLQINPSHQPGKVHCAILMDDLVVRASDQDTVTAIPKDVRVMSPIEYPSPSVPQIAVVHREQYSLLNLHGKTIGLVKSLMRRRFLGIASFKFHPSMVKNEGKVNRSATCHACS